MKRVRIKESGAEILTEYESGCYRSIYSNKLYKEDEIEVIGEEAGFDMTTKTLIESSKNKLAVVKENLEAINNGIKFLERYKNDPDSPSIILKLSFIEQEFGIEKDECMAFLSMRKYFYEREVILIEKEIEYYTNFEKEKSYPLGFMW